METIVERGGLTRMLWISLWLVWGVFIIQQVVDMVRFSAPWPLWLLSVLPLILFMPGVAKDNLRSVVWLCFVTLFYFISTVQLVFARPEDPIAVTGLVSVVGLFVVAVTYIRVRGPELRNGRAAANGSAANADPEQPRHDRTDSDTTMEH